MNRGLRWCMLAAVTALAGCAGVVPHPGARPPVVESGGPLQGRPAPGPGQSGGAQAAPPGAGSSAVLALVDQADRSARAGRLDSAADSLERALRIEPRNARLWHRLAALRLAEGNGAQARAEALQQR